MSAPARLGALLAALAFLLVAAAVNFWPSAERGRPAADTAPQQRAPRPDASAIAPPAPAARGAAAARTPPLAADLTPASPPTPRPAVLRLASPAPTSLDPALAADAASLDVVMALFEGLVFFDAAGAPQGRQAERWEVSDDGQAYTFHLREGLRWSDGRPVTAADYVYAWRRNLAPTLGAAAATSLYPLLNAARIHRGSAPPGSLGVAAPDERTLVATLEAPAPYFLRLAATPALFPLPSGAIAAWGDAWTRPGHLVGNGPFGLAGPAHEDELLLVRSDTYWGDPPSLEAVRVRIFPAGSEAAQLAAYDAGELDAVHHLDATGPAAQLLAGPRRAPDVRLLDELGTMFVAVNHRRRVLSDVRVRQALGMALDRQSLLRALGLPGKPTSSLQPEGIVGRAPALWPGEDVAAAQALLAEAGYPDGAGLPELVFTFNASATWRALGEHLAARWRDTLGIGVRLESLELRAFLRWRRELNPRAGDLYRGGWLGDYADPYNWYNTLWDGREDPFQFNTGWRNADYDELVRRAAREDDPLARAALYGEAEALLAAEYPAIPLYQTGRQVLVRPYVQGFALDPAGGYLLLRAISIAPH